MNETTKLKVLVLFEKHRKSPGSKFDQEHFFDFLMKEPKSKGAFRNSFSGLRRFNAFWDEVQFEFGVCFSIKDRECDYALNEFCARIEELKKSKRSSTASLRNRAKYGFEWNIFVFVNVVLVGIALAANSLKVLAAAVWTLDLYLNYKLISSHLKEKKYIKELEARVLSESNI